MSIIFKVKESEENTVKEESKSYQQLVDFLLADQVALFCKIMTMKLINDNSSWVQFVYFGWILLHTVTVWFFWLIFILTTDCTCGRICFSPCSQSPFVWIACTFAENCRQVSNFWCTLKHTICFQVAFFNFFSIFFIFYFL